MLPHLTVLSVGSYALSSEQQHARWASDERVWWLNPCDDATALNRAMECASRAVESGCDVVALQCVSACHRKVLRGASQHLFEGDKHLGVLYNPSRLVLVEKRVVDLLQKVLHAAHTEPGYAASLPDSALNLARSIPTPMAQLCAFDVTTAGKAQGKLIVVNCGFTDLVSPGDDHRFHAALVRELLRCIWAPKTGFTATHVTNHIVVLGNYGFAPHSPAYKLLTVSSEMCCKSFVAAPEDFVEVEERPCSNGGPALFRCSVTLRVPVREVGEFHAFHGICLPLNVVGSTHKAILELSLSHLEEGRFVTILSGSANPRHGSSDRCIRTSTMGASYVVCEVPEPRSLCSSTRCFRLVWAESREASATQLRQLFPRVFLGEKDERWHPEHGARLRGFSWDRSKGSLAGATREPLRSVYSTCSGAEGTPEWEPQLSHLVASIKFPIPLPLRATSAAAVPASGSRRIETNTLVPLRPGGARGMWATLVPPSEWLKATCSSAAREPLFTSLFPIAAAATPYTTDPDNPSIVFVEGEHFTCATTDYIFYTASTCTPQRIRPLPALASLQGGMPSVGGATVEPSNHCFLQCDLMLQPH